MNFIATTVVIVEILMILLAIFLHKVIERNQPTLPQRNRNRADGKAKLWSGDPSVAPVQYQLHDLEMATNYFSDENKLGKGGFGAVYKGLIDGEIVAIKLLHGCSVQLLGDVAKEVTLLSSLNHINLVKLLGYCSEAGQYLLVYEYIPNGDLRICLNGDKKRELLNWKKRFEIIKGIARGICYLHHNSVNVVVHRDLKPENILLDENYNPRIADFGLSKVFETAKSHKRTRKLAGTLGYIAPELYFQQHYSTRSDVYNYGLLVFEILTGCTIPSYAQANQETLSHVMWKQWKDKRPLEEIIDSSLRENCVDQITRCYLTGLLCVQHDPKRRPNMELVLKMLTTNISLPAPSFPGFFQEYLRHQHSSCRIMLPEEHIITENGSTFVESNPTEHMRQDANISELQSTDGAYFGPKPNSFDLQPTVVTNTYTLEDLKTATDNFSTLLWNDEVYKGVINGQVVVVEKYSCERAISNLVLSTVTVGRRKKFILFPVVKRNVKRSILPLRHDNIIDIMGYCLEVERKLFLVYKHPANGSLYDYLYGSDLSPAHSEWRTRLNIIRGVANGINYLHHGLQDMYLIHGDIKPSCILLDELLNPKLYDFRHLSVSDIKKEEFEIPYTWTTLEYIPPEVFFKGKLSRKSDVYSYGMTLMEILVNEKVGDKGIVLYRIWNLISQAWMNWEQNKILEILHPLLENCCPKEEALRYFQIALLCIQHEPEKRPNMQQVVQMLNNNDPLPPIPSIPFSDHNYANTPSFESESIWRSLDFESEGILDDDDILEPR